MKSKYLLPLVLLMISMLSSCYSPIPLIGTFNSRKPYQPHVDLILEHEGCKVYRFYDMDNYVYFTNCAGDVTAIKDDSTKMRVTNHVRITNDTLEENIKEDLR